jgi:hypothetical protein
MNGAAGQVGPVYLHPGSQARSLGAALARLGFTVEVLTARAHQVHPCVVVTSGPARFVDGTEYLYAAPDDESGIWWFWRVSSRDPLVFEQVAPLSEVSAAADHLIRTRSRVLVGTQSHEPEQTGA